MGPLTSSGLSLFWPPVPSCASGGALWPVVVACGMVRITLPPALVARGDQAITRRHGLAVSVRLRKPEQAAMLMELGIDVLEGKYVAVKGEPVEMT